MHAFRHMANCSNMIQTEGAHCLQDQTSCSNRRAAASSGQSETLHVFHSSLTRPPDLRKIFEKSEGFNMAEEQKLNRMSICNVVKENGTTGFYTFS